MSDSEEESLVSFGTPLEPLDEDEIPRKKPLNIEDQIATDEYGRRRFHGAFTGGFSAGFFNTVGSLEGWQPRQFKSSRNQKTESKSQKPEDFMDDEDLNEFGIAPQTIRSTDDYNMAHSSQKRKRVINQGNIFGQSTLEKMLEPSKETIGIKLLKNMGWKPGQGVGPRVTKAEKSKQKKVYGCEIPKEFRSAESIDTDSSEEDDSDLNELLNNITFAPDDYDIVLNNVKEDTSGMGYKGLSKEPILSKFSLMPEQNSFNLTTGKNKKLSIVGKGFGVGAFEEDDEDVYSHEDMSQYDFHLDDAKSTKTTPALKKQSDLYEKFIKAKRIQIKKQYPLPNLPKNFVPIYNKRVSRFEPVQEKIEIKEKKTLNADLRKNILNEPIKIVKPVSQKETISKLLGNFENKFVSKIEKPSGQDEYKTELLKLTEEQLKRYYIYKDLIEKNEVYRFKEHQPISMTEWEQLQEKMLFDRILNRKSNAMISDKFVRGEQEDDLSSLLSSVEKTTNSYGISNDMRQAAKKKMFGSLTRETIQWRPCSLLCKRFNVPEPDVSCNNEPPSQPKKVAGVFENIDQVTEKMQQAFSKSNSEQKIENISSKNAGNLSSKSEVIRNETKTSDVEHTLVKEIQKSTELPSTSNEDSSKTEMSKEMTPMCTLKNIDLFKNIFLSSSEDEGSEDETNKAKDQIELMKNFEKPSGIFANLDLDLMRKQITENLKKTNVENSKIVENVEISKSCENQISNKQNTKSIVIPSCSKVSFVNEYGPKLPEVLPSKHLEIDISSSSSSDEWIEKKHKSHNKKKHKKHKSKKKKKHKKKNK